LSIVEKFVSDWTEPGVVHAKSYGMHGLVTTLLSHMVIDTKFLEEGQHYTANQMRYPWTLDR
jgi:hypothetical protein